MKLSIVIPAYNEEPTIEALIQRVLETDLSPVEKEVIVVDDGSKDGTSRILAQCADRVMVLTHPKNRGKGAAVRTGFAAASGDFVVVQDADLEYDPEDFRDMLAEAEQTGAKVVYGSRYLPRRGGGQKQGSWLFFLGGLSVTMLTNLLYGTHITDEPTCYKMIHRDVLKRLNLTAEGFEFCPEITAKVTRLGVPIREVPIHYAPRTAKEGKKIRLRDWFIAVWTLLKNRI